VQYVIPTISMTFRVTYQTKTQPTFTANACRGVA
jgi:hypothetical protein